MNRPPPLSIEDKFRIALDAITAEEPASAMRHRVTYAVDGVCMIVMPGWKFYQPMEIAG